MGAFMAPGMGSLRAVPSCLATSVCPLFFPRRSQLL